MSQKIDPREVLAYLNELGYTNISAQQLKEFIKDLKKVMKYDSRYGNHKQTEAVMGVHSYSTEKTGYERDDNLYEESGYDEFSGSKENETFNTTNGSDKENFQPQKHSDRLPKIQATSMQKNKHIAVHIYDNKNKKLLDHRHCVHLDQIDVIDSKIHGPHEEELNIRKFVSKHESSESSVKCIPPCSTRTTIPSARSRTSSKDRKSKVTFIRPTITKPPINKCDPVALYHYYQSEWKKSKIPGQVNRDDLRWAIRERMLNGPRVEVKTRCNIPRCGWSR